VDRPAEHDAFVAGNDVTLAAPVSGNAHLFGMNITSNAPVGGDLYAAGFTVNLGAPVAGSLSAAGNAVSVRVPTSVGGNARLAGASVTLAGPVSGSALVAAQSLTLDSSVAHDLSFHGQTLTFGPGAKVGGILSIQAPYPIAVPASVAAADRVKYQQGPGTDYLSQAGSTAGGIASGFWPQFWAIAFWWVILFLIGAGLIGFAPGMMGAADVASLSRPGQKLLFGALAFAAMLGLVPVLALTVVGLLLLPLLLIFIVVACAVGYVAGVFFAGLRTIGGVAPIDTTPKRLAVLAASLAVAGLLGMVPLAGWLLNVLLLMFGLGLITAEFVDRWFNSGSWARLAHSAAPPAASPPAS
jgi:hypothetical protein